MKQDSEEWREDLKYTNTVCGRNCCGKCCGRSSGGCGSLELTQAEANLLLTFAVLPFQPVVGKDTSDRPVYAYPEGMVEEHLTTNVCPEIISALMGKGLIEVDYNIPLRNFGYSGFEDYPLHGSMALTLRGQQVMDQLFFLGFGAAADGKGDKL